MCQTHKHVCVFWPAPDTVFPCGSNVGPTLYVGQCWVYRRQKGARMWGTLSTSFHNTCPCFWILPFEPRSWYLDTARSHAMTGFSVFGAVFPLQPETRFFCWYRADYRSARSLRSTQYPRCLLPALCLRCINDTFQGKLQRDFSLRVFLKCVFYHILFISREMLLRAIRTKEERKVPAAQVTGCHHPSADARQLPEQRTARHNLFQNTRLAIPR